MSFTHLGLPTASTVTQVNEKGKERYYRIGDAKLYSCTSVVNFPGRQAIEDWKENTPNWKQIGQESMKLGTHLHKRIEEYLHNAPLPVCNPSDYFYNPITMFNSMKPYLDKIDNIRGLEAKSYSIDLGIAGTIDCLAEYEGQLSVIDFKSSRHPKNEEWILNYKMQCYCYSRMAKETWNLDAPQGILIIGNAEDQPSQLFQFDVETVADDFEATLLDYKDHYNAKNIV